MWACLSAGLANAERTLARRLNRQQPCRIRLTPRMNFGRLLECHQYKNMCIVTASWLCLKETSLPTAALLLCSRNRDALPLAA